MSVHLIFYTKVFYRNKSEKYLQYEETHSSEKDAINSLINHLDNNSVFCFKTIYKYLYNHLYQHSLDKKEDEYEDENDVNCDDYIDTYHEIKEKFTYIFTDDMMFILRKLGKNSSSFISYDFFYDLFDIYDNGFLEFLKSKIKTIVQLNEFVEAFTNNNRWTQDLTSKTKFIFSYKITENVK
jgi:hypothetical protein